MNKVRRSADGHPGASPEPIAARIPPRPGLTALPSAPIQQKTVQLGTVEAPFPALLRHWSKPLGVVAALLLAMALTGQPLAPAAAALALVAALIARQIFGPVRAPGPPAPLTDRAGLMRLTFEWCLWTTVALCLFRAFRLEDLFSHDMLLAWLTLTPLSLLLCDRWSARALGRTGAAHERHIIIGANEIGVELARRLAQSGDAGTFLGFFDFRSPERLPEGSRGHLSGRCQDVAAFVQRHAVNAIYIALPMSNAPRIEGMLREFRDTTASIYFVPDIFAFDLVQARCVESHGIPMLAVCDTPFHGMNAVQKRATDLLLSSIGLLLAWPLMLAAACAVKLSSPGPVLFRQRRYGLHGEEILVYKFRSMTVCEDGPVVVQAVPRDRRFTAVGRLLRRTSLDELPQLLNVFRGSMSFVGPRPHAVAHNEMYRKLISGYMIRHKVRPGITGWAQVHGLRGETRSIEQMRLRVQYDLDYLRDWSLALDLKIMLKTALIVLFHRKAY